MLPRTDQITYPAGEEQVSTTSELRELRHRCAEMETERARLYAEVSRLSASSAKYLLANIEVGKINLDLQIEIDRLRTALEWYGEDWHYSEIDGNGRWIKESPVQRDRGATARAALEALNVSRS